MLVDGTTTSHDHSSGLLQGLLIQGFRSQTPSQLDVEQPAVGEPDAELLGCSYAVFDDGGVDLEAADLSGVARQPKPHVFDAQHCCTLLVSDLVTQHLMPPSDILKKIMQLQRQVELPNSVATFNLKRNVIPLFLDVSCWAPVGPFISIVETDHS